MLIKNLKLKNFRNYDNLDIEFSSNQNIIIGNNAQGKTNIIEAIYYLAITKSFLVNSDNTIINNNSDSSKIIGDILSNNRKKKLSILINSMTKKLQINDKVIKKHASYIGNLKVILFNPDNVRILKEAPGNRRRFLNIELSQLYSSYVNLLNDYNLLLKQRNEYLKNIKLTSNCNAIYMDIINDKYVSLNVLIVKYRDEFIKKINEYIDDIYYNIAGDKGLKIIYNSCIPVDEENVMRQNLLDKVKKSYDREIVLGNSLIGSHREDFGFYLNDLDLSLYGSQGQVKMAILSLRLAESFVFKDICMENPILLLDDVFSELDINKRNNLIKYLNFDIQSIITTTDLNDIDSDFASKANVYIVENCNITMVNNREKV